MQHLEPGVAPVREPTRFSFLDPFHGGPALRELRAWANERGICRLSHSGDRIFVDLVPGTEQPLLALDMIVRSDAAGLRRVVLSAISEVDEIVIGVDGRSDDETLEVAKQLADRVWSFDHVDIGLSPEAWAANRIHFANARNLGRGRVAAPWTLFLDSDEVLLPGEKSFRTWIAEFNEKPVGAFGITVDMGSLKHMDDQRLALTHYRWANETHNALLMDQMAVRTDRTIVHDTSLRSAKEQQRRIAQRENGIAAMVDEAEQGNISAIFHLAKHKAFGGELAEAVKYTLAYRERTEIHGLLAADRAHLAAILALKFFEADNDTEAELWALRSLLDGPNIEALSLLGDLAELRGDLQAARGWYTAACATPIDPARINLPAAAENRFHRLAGIEKALNGEPATQVEFVQGNEG